MKKPSVIGNYIWNLSYQILAMITPLITIPYLSETLGGTTLGINDFAESIVSYFVLFGCVGTGLYGQKEIAYCKDNPEQRSRVFWELVLIRLCAIVFSLTVYGALVVRAADYPLVYMLYAIEIVANLFDIGWFFQGLENFKIQSLRNFCVKIIGVVLIFALVKTQDDLWKYILIYSGTMALGNVTLWFSIPKYLRRVSPKELHIFRHFRPVVWLFLPQIATSIYTQLDKTMIGWLSDYAQVSYYSYAEKIVKICMTVVTSVGLVMMSRVASSFSERNMEQIQEYIRKSFRFLCFLGLPISFGIAAVAPNFVPWFFAAEYAPSADIMIILSPIVFIIGASGVFGTQYLLPTNQLRKYTVSIMAGTVSNFILNLLLIPRLGGRGAAIATVCAELMVLAVQLVLLRGEISMRIFLGGIKSFISGLVMFAAVVELGKQLPETIRAHWQGTLIQMGTGVVLYALLLFVLRDRFFLDTFGQMVHGIRHLLHLEKKQKP